VLHRPGVTAPLLGVRNVEQLEDNLGAVGWRLDSEQIASLDHVSEPYEGYPFELFKLRDEMHFA
jgi:aryl-alcohol dehydrogenase-like predicted oxidoreductase